MFVDIRIQRLAHYPKEFPLPEYMSAGASGLDLRAAIQEPLTLSPLARELIPTGIVLAIPQGFEAQVRPRSGLALKKGLTLLNTPGTIDSDYRGELKVIIINLSDKPCIIEAGERIAQIIFAPVVQAQWQEVNDLSTEAKTSRGEGGFGHTGRH